MLISVEWNCPLARINSLWRWQISSAILHFLLHLLLAYFQDGELANQSSCKEFMVSRLPKTFAISLKYTCRSLALMFVWDLSCRGPNCFLLTLPYLFVVLQIIVLDVLITTDSLSYSRVRFHSASPVNIPILQR